VPALIQRGRHRVTLEGMHHLVWPLPVLQGGPLRPLHGRRWLDLRTHDVFAAAAETHALKVVLTAEPVAILPEHAAIPEVALV